MDTPALKDKDLFPSDDVLRQTLGASYPAFERWREMLTARQIDLDWRYYNDGNAWLCKMMSAKNNLGWLIACDGCFRTTFYFTAKYAEAIAGAEIPGTAKEEYRRAEPTAKLRPLSVRISDNSLLNDALAILQLKQKLK